MVKPKQIPKKDWDKELEGEDVKTKLLIQRCKAQAQKDVNKAVFDIQVKLEKVWSESWDKKIKALTARHKTEQSILRNYYEAKMQELKDVPVDLLHTFRCSDAYELGKKETLKEVKEKLEKLNNPQIESKPLCVVITLDEWEAVWKELGGEK